MLNFYKINYGLPHNFFKQFSSKRVSEKTDFPKRQK